MNGGQYIDMSTTKRKLHHFIVKCTMRRLLKAFINTENKNMKQNTGNPICSDDAAITL